MELVKTNNIIPDWFSFIFFVKTAHESSLEFVLAEAEDRNQKDAGYYSEELVSMIRDDFKNKEEFSVTDTCIYGDLSITVQVSNITDINEALQICDSVTARWVSKFNINKMKKGE